jgi:hypothetical protein
MATKTKEKSKKKAAASKVAKKRGRTPAVAAVAAPKVKRRKIVAWTRADFAELRKHSKAKTPIGRIAKAMKRTPGALRQKARALGVKIGQSR